MASTLIVTRVTAEVETPVFVVSHDGKGVLRFAAAPDSYYADTVVPGLRRRAEKGLSADEAEQVVDNLNDRFSSDHRMSVEFGQSSSVLRRGELLFRQWGTD